MCPTHQGAASYVNWPRREEAGSLSDEGGPLTESVDVA